MPLPACSLARLDPCPYSLLLAPWPLSQALCIHLIRCPSNSIQLHPILSIASPDLTASLCKPLKIQPRHHQGPLSEVKTWTPEPRALLGPVQPSNCRPISASRTLAPSTTSTALALGAPSVFSLLHRGVRQHNVYILHTCVCTIRCVRLCVCPCTQYGICCVFHLTHCRCNYDAAHEDGTNVYRTTLYRLGRLDTSSATPWNKEQEPKGLTWMSSWRNSGSQPWSRSAGSLSRSRLQPGHG